MTTEIKERKFTSSQRADRWFDRLTRAGYGCMRVEKTLFFFHPKRK